MAALAFDVDVAWIGCRAATLMSKLLNVTRWWISCAISGSYKHVQLLSRDANLIARYRTYANMAHWLNEGVTAVVAAPGVAQADQDVEIGRKSLQGGGCRNT